jgi:hypothetical protein
VLCIIIKTAGFFKKYLKFHSPFKQLPTNKILLSCI